MVGGSQAISSESDRVCAHLETFKTTTTTTTTTNTNTTNAAPQNPYNRIYRKLFPVLLRLAVDADKVTRDLFKSLVFQLIHWFTKNGKSENPETMSILQASFDAVSSPNGAVCIT
jgi:DNA-dependent protein kinase catalytic subunit